MSWDKVSITCQCYEFDHSLNFFDRSIFNAPAVKTPVGSAVELMDYAIDIGTLSFSSKRSDTSSGYVSLINECGDITLKLSGIKNNNFLRNYFNVFDKTGNNQFLKYIINIRYANELVFTGYVNQDDISQQFNNDKDNKIISVQVLGIEKDFTNYFSHKELLDTHIFYNYFVEMPFKYDVNAGLIEDQPKCNAKSVGSVFEDNSEGSLTVSEIGGSDVNKKWYMTNIPYFYQKANSETDYFWWLKSGYIRWQDDEHYNVYDFLNKMCTSMGWVWKVKRGIDDFHYVLTIVDSDNSLNTQIVNLDFNNVIDCNVGYNLTNSNVDYIIIKSGFHITNSTFNGTRGIHFVLESNKLSTPVPNESNFFENVIRWSDGHYTLAYNTPPNPNVKYQILNYVQANNTLVNYGVFHHIDNTWGYAGDIASLQSNRILVLDTGENSQYTVVQLQIRRNLKSPDDSMPNNDEIKYKGNVGSGLFQFKENEYDKILYDYNTYCRTSLQFYKNMNVVLNQLNNQILDITTHDLIFDTSKVFNIVNSKEVELNNTQSLILSLEVDMINETSKIKLLRI